MNVSFPDGVWFLQWDTMMETKNEKTLVEQIRKIVRDQLNAIDVWDWPEWNIIIDEIHELLSVPDSKYDIGGAVGCSFQWKIVVDTIADNIVSRLRDDGYIRKNGE